MKFWLTIIVLTLIAVYLLIERRIKIKDNPMTKTIFLIIFLFAFSLVRGEEIYYGKASWYGNESICPQWKGYTKNGEMFDENKLTCAMPNKNQINKWYKVTNIENNKSVIVWANDTGSFAKYGRVIDLSKCAFKQIGNLDSGIIKVKIEETQNQRRQE